jgi:hypothetical protein
LVGPDRLAALACDAWQIEAASRGLPRDGDYWQLGQEWIAAEPAARRPGW